jgi:phage-related protein
LYGRPKRRWTIEFFWLPDGSEPVRKWLDDLPGEVRGKVLARIDLMAEHGPNLDYPYTSQIEGPLRELRLRFGKTRYRVLYFFDENRAGILLHGFTKNTASVEDTDKKIAKARIEQHSERLKKQKPKQEQQKKR